MVIENIMYFVLGLLVAGLLALILLPAVWRRAVRLTKKRIEAATPMTMAEFRADKDQLRAEFALSTRRLEQNAESLRRRLADQLRDASRRTSELSGIKGERDSHLQIVGELEEREAESRRRILELEKHVADVTQKLRMRDRELAEKSSQLDAARESLRAAGSAGRGRADDRENTGKNRAEVRAESMNFRQQMAGRPDTPSPLEEETERLRGTVADIEGTIMADWDSDRIEPSHLRGRLSDIAAHVSGIVHALEDSDPAEHEQSLADRMQKFVDAEDAATPVRGPNARRGAPAEGQPVSDRLKALRELRDNT
jgi:chromosome segregation ATPase